MNLRGEKMIKTCERCGKQKNMMSWETMCYSCCKEKELERIQQAIEDGESPDTSSSDYAICPYCGTPHEQLSYGETPEMYAEGTDEMQCDTCEKFFKVHTTVSYYWRTEKLEV